MSAVTLVTAISLVSLVTAIALVAAISFGDRYRNLGERYILVGAMKSGERHENW